MRSLSHGLLRHDLIFIVKLLAQLPLLTEYLYLARPRLGEMVRVLTALADLLTLATHRSRITPHLLRLLDSIGCLSHAGARNFMLL